MDSTAIYQSTIDSYVKHGLPEIADLKIAMPDTNSWTDVARATRESPEYHKLILQRMFNDSNIVVIPEIILRECAGSGKQVNMTDTRFNELYEPAFREISAQIDIHVVTFSDMEEMMLNSNGGKRDYALREALLVANELFAINSHVKAALASVQRFEEIEAALAVIPEDAGERVLLFFTMLFLNEYWSVDIFTNEVAVYTDRMTFVDNEKLREVIGSISVEGYYDSFSLTSLDVVLFDVLSEHDSQWSEEIKNEFVTQTRKNRPRKIYIKSDYANFSNIVHCNNNNDFLMKYKTWKDSLISIAF